MILPLSSKKVNKKLRYTNDMIAHLRGSLLKKDPSSIIVETGGVGYALSVPVSTFSQLPEVGSDVSLHTFQYVREDTLALYGFSTEAEKNLFTELLGVSGIGPKVALAILSVASPSDIRTAIASGDTAFLSSVPGIGKKTAERVVVDLRDKMDSFTEPTDRGPVDDVVAALVGLGYSNNEARKAASGATGASTDELLRSALKEIGR